jgi:hypothetical protein
MGISGLNIYGHISAQEKRIMTLDDSSKCTSPQDTQCATVKKLRDGVITEVKLTKVCFKGNFTAEFQSTAENIE